MGERLGAGYATFDSILVRGENFFGGHVGNAVAAILGRRAATEPEVIVGEADAQIGAGPRKCRAAKRFFSRAARG
jgi:hypothetical protein